MTHSGGRLHNIGDQGQWFEVTYFDPVANVRKVFGWSDSVEGAQAMSKAIELHPSMEYGQLWDRTIDPTGDPFAERDIDAARNKI
jgi:hypothetical protein